MIGDVEDCLRTDLPRLADLRIEGRPLADAPEPTRSRWGTPQRFAVAAAIVLVVGLGALVLFDQSDDDEVIETADVEETVPETAPPTTDPMATLRAELGDAEATIDVYSGLVNPTFVLDAARVAEVLDVVAGLEVIDGAGLDAGGLGFRGFLLTPSGKPLDPSVEVRADHVVVRYPDGTVVVRTDPDGTTLAALAELASAEIEALGFDPDALVDAP